jgi:hypothetical protein
MLDKALSEVEASRKSAETDKALIDALNRQAEAYKSLSQTQEQLIKAQDRQIERLIKIKCNKTSYFFGIISTKRCYD